VIDNRPNQTSKPRSSEWMKERANATLRRWPAVVDRLDEIRPIASAVARLAVVRPV
jgi:hypothetical protein